MEKIDINEETLAFYFELGLTISQFTHLAQSLHQVMYYIFKDSEPKEGFLKNFFDKDTFGGQLNIAQEHLPDHLREDLHNQWMEIDKQLEEAKNNRNLLAHGWIFTDTDAPAGQRCMLVPGAGKYWKPDSAPHENGTYLLDIVRMRYFNFHASQRLHRLLWMLKGKPESEAEPVLGELEEPDLYSIIRQPYSYLNVRRGTE